MIKQGDKFTNIKSGEVFTVRSIKSDTVILITKDNFHSIIINQKGIDATFMPFVEKEEKMVPKSK